MSPERLSRWMIALVVLTANSAPALAQKIDVVTLDNGERVIGEIKELDRGLLRYKTDHMSTVFVEWGRIVKITSLKTMQIETRDGSLYFGSLGEPPEPHQIAVIGLVSEQILVLDDVVRIYPIKDGFWKKLDGSFSLGLTFTKASDVLQSSVAFDASYRTRKRLLNLRINSIITNQRSIETSRKQDAALTYDWLFDKRFVLAIAALQQNTELGIKLRAITGGGVGYHAVQTRRTALDLIIGMSVNRETTLDEVQSTNVEAVGGVRYNVFRRSAPKTDLISSLWVFRTVDGTERTRLDLNAKLRQELLTDFFFDLTYYWNFDSKPPTDAASSNDYGVVASLGWSF